MIMGIHPLPLAKKKLLSDLTNRSTLEHADDGARSTPKSVNQNQAENSIKKLESTLSIMKIMLQHVATISIILLTRSIILFLLKIIQQLTRIHKLANVVFCSRKSLFQKHPQLDKSSHSWTKIYLESWGVAPHPARSLLCFGIPRYPSAPNHSLPFAPASGWKVPIFSQ